MLEKRQGQFAQRVTALIRLLGSSSIFNGAEKWEFVSGSGTDPFKRSVAPRSVVWIKDER